MSDTKVTNDELQALTEQYANKLGIPLTDNVKREITDIISARVDALKTSDKCLMPDDIRERVGDDKLCNTLTTFNVTMTPNEWSEWADSVKAWDANEPSMTSGLPMKPSVSSRSRAPEMVEVAPGIMVSARAIDVACGPDVEEIEAMLVEKRAKADAAYEQQKADLGLTSTHVEDVLNDGTTKPLVESYVEALTYIITTRRHQNEVDLPEWVIFGVPDRDITGDTDVSKVNFEQHRYIYERSLPEELVRVVQQFRAIKSNGDIAARGGQLNFEFLLKFIDELRASVLKAQASSQAT